MAKAKALSRGDKVIAFIETYCKVPEGALVGKPIKLAAFQKDFIRAIYDNKQGTRRAILSIARKNGKSALIGGLLLAHICGPEARTNSQVVSGAMSRDQASLVFHLAVKMINQEPILQQATRVVPSTKMIIGLVKNVEYKALAADGTTAHGLSPALAIIDEVGQIKGPTTPFIDAITSSQGAHENPLLITISTQASSDADCLSLWIDDALRSGDPHTICHVYEAEKDCDLMDQAQWKKANPALDLFRSRKDLEEQLKQAARIPTLEATSRNLLLNQRIALESIWLAPRVWKENAGDPDFAVFRNTSLVSLGLDLSMRNDLTAAVISARGSDGVVHLYPFVFAPETGMKERELRDKAPYTEWVRQGAMIAVPGATLDYDWVFGFLKQELDRMQISVSSIQFDRWRILEAKAAADRVGFAPYSEWVEVGQGYQSMSPRIEAFETFLLKTQIRHGGHPLLNMSAANAIVVRDPAGNRKIDKSKTTQRIDPLVAAVMSVGAFIAPAAEVDVSSWIV
jgi:phage terminase large subunit-like protein